MARLVYRVCRARYARLDGEGARRVGGRWNSPGRPVVYAAASVALAVLENLVHMSRENFPTGYVCVTASLPDDLNVITENELRTVKALQQADARTLGDWWFDNRASAVLEVKSSIVPTEHNYLLNPTHPEFDRIEVYPPAIFHFDDRLFPR